MMKKLSVPVAAVVLVTGLAGAAGASVPSPATAPRRDAAAPSGVLDPGPYHRRLDPLVGTWKAVKTNYILGGGKPVVSRDITVRTRWIGKTGGRFLEERTEGTLAGNHYYRLGILGFSNIDRRYEWTTFDSVTPVAMTYRGKPVTGTPSVLSIPGEFTDPGLLGPRYYGKTIPMRTVISLPRNGHPTFDLYFTPPGQKERLADRVVYTRRIR
ncbi:DUF1579 domain-containing protein [Actinomadura logoneensis]|uniref:DUF1579 domain-containing protein n=1 Tax=Actinomadura logoneensis TaxID=2293572 RepID=A0A372JII2_9ACTN|nr:DUF1579 family protein [Actinomadura logoneensis]RFU39616.1 DUF1579 domain-containing protein [Actinomadura logoneensis]